MSLYGMLAPLKSNGLGYRSTAEDATQNLDLSGQTILVTGANSGLGQETLRVLSSRGAHIVAAARTIEKAEIACRAAPSGLASPVACDLSEPGSVRACVEKTMAMNRPLDAIICNAGIMALPKLEQKYGYELQFFTNHIGHYLLVTDLVESLQDTGRVVVVSSRAHESAPNEGIQFDNFSGEKKYNGFRAYGQSKLANLLFARQLAREFEGTKRIAHAIHPGVIKTNLFRHMNPLVAIGLGIAGPLAFKSIPEGAATQCYVAVHPEAATSNGCYWSHCNQIESSQNGSDMNMAQKLWDVSEEIAKSL